MDGKRPATWAKIDRTFERLTKWMVYVGAAVLIVIMLIAFVDVIIAKLFGSSIKYATEIITYCDVPLAYLGMAYTLLIGQMTSVDILFCHFSKGIQKVLSCIYDLAGMGFCVFLGKLSLDNTFSYFAKGTLSNPKGGFPIWPFAGIETLSWLVLALAFLFCFIRLLLGVSHEAERPAEGGEEQ